MKVVEASEDSIVLKPGEWYVTLRGDDGGRRTMCEWRAQCPQTGGVGSSVLCSRCPACGRSIELSGFAAREFWERAEIKEPQ